MTFPLLFLLMIAGRSGMMLWQPDILKQYDATCQKHQAFLAMVAIRKVTYNETVGFAALNAIVQHGRTGQSMPFMLTIMRGENP